MASSKTHIEGKIYSNLENGVIVSMGISIARTIAVSEKLIPSQLKSSIKIHSKPEEVEDIIQRMKNYGQVIDNEFGIIHFHEDGIDVFIPVSKEKMDKATENMQAGIPLDFCGKPHIYSEAWLSQQQKAMIDEQLKDITLEPTQTGSIFKI